MKKSILTIGIPTYNRANQLDKAIKVIFEELSSLKHKVELLVSDNNSNDNTFKVVDKWREKLDINYFKNETNLGFDSNVDLVVKNASSNYVLILSDDDILIPGSLKYYLDIISKTKDVSIIIGKARFMNHEMNHEVLNFSDKAFSKFKEHKTYEFENGVELFSFTEKIFCGISGVLFNREKYLRENLDDFFNSQFIHTAAMFKILSGNFSKVFIINNPCLNYRLGDSKKTEIKNQNEIMKVGLGILHLLTQIKEDYPKDIWYKIYEKELNWTRSLLIGIKSREGISPKIKKSYLEIIDSERNYKIIDSVILNAPDFFFKLSYKIYRLIRYGNLGYK